MTSESVEPRQSEAMVGSTDTPDGIPVRVDELLAAMTLTEKAGQLTQYFYFRLPETADAEPALGLDVAKQPGMVRAALERGEVGSLLFVTDPAEINRLQRRAVDGNRLGIPLLFGSTSSTGCAPSSRCRSRWRLLRPGDDRAGTGGRRPRGPGGGYPLGLRADGGHRPGPLWRPVRWASLTPFFQKKAWTVASPVCRATPATSPTSFTALAEPKVRHGPPDSQHGVTDVCARRRTSSTVGRLDRQSPLTIEYTSTRSCSRSSGHSAATSAARGGPATGLGAGDAEADCWAATATENTCRVARLPTAA
jgi:hypothetical protein